MTNPLRNRTGRPMDYRPTMIAATLYAVNVAAWLSAYLRLS